MKYKNDFILLVLFIVVFTILSVLSPDRFLSYNNLQTMAYQMPEFGILTLGMMIAILTGGINLSITAVSALSGIMTALFLVNCNAAADTNVFFIVAGALGIALICAVITGFINGFIIAFIGVTPILATLGAKIFFEGICLKITKGGSISGYPEQFYFLGSGTIFNIPVSIIIFISIIILTYFLLDRTPWGTRVYMIGSNPVAAKFSGINVKKILLQVYIYSSLMAAIASIIMISRYNSAKVTLGSSYLLESVAAAVLGGTSIVGGKGSVFGTVIAIGIIQIISSGLNILNLNRFITDAIMGALLIVVLTINYISDKLKTKNISFNK